MMIERGTASLLRGNSIEVQNIEKSWSSQIHTAILIQEKESERQKIGPVCILPPVTMNKLGLIKEKDPESVVAPREPSWIMERSGKGAVSKSARY